MGPERPPGRAAVRVIRRIADRPPAALLATAFLIAPFGFHQAFVRPAAAVPHLVGELLGIGLASFYLVPALMLQDHVSTALLWSPLLPAEHLVSLEPS